MHGEVLLGRERLPLDTVGRFEHTTAPTDARVTAPRTTIAWDDGSWWSVRNGSGPRWEGSVVHPLEPQGLELATQSLAVIPVGDHVVTRSIGAARSDGRSGIGWMESST